jgi:hypothetical protein
VEATHVAQSSIGEPRCRYDRHFGLIGRDFGVAPWISIESTNASPIETPRRVRWIGASV